MNGMTGSIRENRAPTTMGKIIPSKKKQVDWIGTWIASISTKNSAHETEVEAAHQIVIYSAQNNESGTGSANDTIVEARQLESDAVRTSVATATTATGD